MSSFLPAPSGIPQIGQFGIWPLVTATLMTSIIAMVVAIPLGLFVAIYLSEYASPRARSILKPILEILSGIPTVVYGYFALTFMTPLLRKIFGMDTVQIYNTASAGIVIGILILPLVSSMSEDALSAVPRALREAAYGLGATKWETAIKVVVPAALSGITAAFIVSISRAIGETMIVAIAAGAGSNFTFNPFDAAETMTGHIVRISGGDISYNSIDYNSIFAIGLVLVLHDPVAQHHQPKGRAPIPGGVRIMAFLNKKSVFQMQDPVLSRQSSSKGTARQRVGSSCSRPRPSSASSSWRP